jgi:hypothetical protein
MVKKIIRIVVLLGALAVIGPFAIAFFVGVMSGGKSHLSVENTINGDVFRHGATGWTFKIPAGWQQQTAAEAQQLTDAGRKNVEAASGQSVPKVDKPEGELALINGPGNMLNFKFSEFDKKRFPTSDAVIDMVGDMTLASYKKMAEPNGFKVESKKESKKLSQHDFRYFEYTVSNPESKEVALRNRTYLTGIDGRLAMISLSCTTEEKCRQITEAVESASFVSVQ